MQGLVVVWEAKGMFFDRQGSDTQGGGNPQF